MHQHGAYFLWLLFLFKADDVADLAVQRVAQGVQRFGADGLPLLHAVEGVGGKALLEHQLVLRDALSEQRLIKGLVTDHLHHRDIVYHAQHLDYTQ